MLAGAGPLSVSPCSDLVGAGARLCPLGGARAVHLWNSKVTGEGWGGQQDLDIHIQACFLETV